MCVCVCVYVCVCVCVCAHVCGRMCMCVCVPQERQMKCYAGVRELFPSAQAVSTYVYVCVHAMCVVQLMCVV